MFQNGADNSEILLIPNQIPSSSHLAPEKINGAQAAGGRFQRRHRAGIRQWEIGRSVAESGISISVLAVYVAYDSIRTN